MHFHLPKPLHGWRAFAGEVGIIVFGVLIALGAEQVVGSVHQATQARDGREAVRRELEFNLARLSSRADIRSCVDRRLADIQALLDGVGESGAIKTPAWIGRPQLWTMQTARWDASSRAGEAALLSRGEACDCSTSICAVSSVALSAKTANDDTAKKPARIN